LREDDRDLLPAVLPGAAAQIGKLFFRPHRRGGAGGGVSAVPAMSAGKFAPDLDAWRGTSATVSRALKLIESGTLDGGDVASLADRLDIGERHLRRLFRQHIGAAPVTIAQTRRVLLAQAF
jgi:AraC family transcriptional regulator of adaptative response / DNA-3-methyladenine glycosylase II